MSYFLRNLHFIVIHVPIAMLLFSIVFDALAAILKRKEWHTAGLLSLVVGTLGAIAAVITGPEGERNPLFPTHELFGKITMAVFILLTLLRLWMHLKKKLEIGRNLGYLAGMLVGVLLLSYTGHLGGQMVHPDRSNFPGGQFRENGNLRQQPRIPDGQNPQGEKQYMDRSQQMKQIFV